MDDLPTGISDQATADRMVLVPNNGPWTPWQLRKLIELDLLVPVPPFQPAARPAYVPVTEHCFVHIDFTTKKLVSWNLHDYLSLMFDGEPPSGYQFLTFDDSILMAHIMHLAGAFPSVGEARRNGWNKPIPPGFSEHIVGKRKVTVLIQNKYAHMFDYFCDYRYCRCHPSGISKVPCPFLPVQKTEQ